MPCMSGIFRSSTIRSTGSIASLSIASRPLPACVDFTFRREPNDVITIRLIVGESSTTKILFVLVLSDTSEDTLQPERFSQIAGEHNGKSGNAIFGGRLLYGKVRNYQSRA